MIIWIFNDAVGLKLPQFNDYTEEEKVPSHPKFWDDYHNQELLAKVLNDHELITILKSYLSDLTYYDKKDEIENLNNKPRYYTEVRDYLVAKETPSRFDDQDQFTLLSVDETKISYYSTYFILPFAFSIVLLILFVTILYIASLLIRCYIFVSEWLGSEELKPFDLYKLNKHVRGQIFSKSIENDLLDELDYDENKEEVYNELIDDILTDYGIKIYGSYIDEVDGSVKDDLNYLADTEASNNVIGDVGTTSSLFSKYSQKTSVSSDGSIGDVEVIEKECNHEHQDSNKLDYESSFQNVDVFGSGIDDLRELVDRPDTSMRERFNYVFGTTAADSTTEVEVFENKEDRPESTHSSFQKVSEEPDVLFFKWINEQTRLYLLQIPPLTEEYFDKCYSIRGTNERLINTTPLLMNSGGENEQEDDEDGENYESSDDEVVIDFVDLLFNPDYFNNYQSYAIADITGKLMTIRTKLGEVDTDNNLYQKIFERVDNVFEILKTRMKSCNEVNHEIRLSFIGILRDSVIYQNDNSIDIDFVTKIVNYFLSLLNMIDFISISVNCNPIEKYKSIEFGFILHALVEVLTCISFDHLQLVISNVFKDSRFCNDPFVTSLNWVDFEILKILTCFNFTRLNESKEDFSIYSQSINLLLSLNTDVPNHGFDTIWGKLTKSWEYKSFRLPLSNKNKTDPTVKAATANVDEDNDEEDEDNSENYHYHSSKTSNSTTTYKKNKYKKYLEEISPSNKPAIE